PCYFSWCRPICCRRAQYSRLLQPPPGPSDLKGLRERFSRACPISARPHETGGHTKEKSRLVGERLGLIYGSGGYCTSFATLRICSRAIAFSSPPIELTKAAALRISPIPICSFEVCSAFGLPVRGALREATGVSVLASLSWPSGTDSCVPCSSSSSIISIPAAPPGFRGPLLFFAIFLLPPMVRG